MARQYYMTNRPWVINTKEGWIDKLTRLGYKEPTHRFNELLARGILSIKICN